MTRDSYNLVLVLSSEFVSRHRIAASPCGGKDRESAGVRVPRLSYPSISVVTTKGLKALESPRGTRTGGSPRSSFILPLFRSHRPIIPLYPFFLPWSRLAFPPPRAPSPISAPRLKPALITSRNRLYHRPQASHHRPSYRSTRRMRVSGVRDAARADGSSRHLAENITITAGPPLSKKMEGKQKSQECVCHFNSIYRH